jgi:hypothetical protein
VTLHVVKTDVLLYALGGFAPEPMEWPAKNFLPMKLIREIKRVAAKPKASYGEVRTLATRYQRDYKSMGTWIYLARRNRTPAYWNSA